MVCVPVRRDNPQAGPQTMLYLACTTITSVDLAQYGVSRATDWVSVDCGTNTYSKFLLLRTHKAMTTSLLLQVFAIPNGIFLMISSLILSE